MRPPIPEPNGDVGSLTDQQISQGIAVTYEMSFAALFRRNIKGTIGEAVSIPIILIVVSIVTAILLPVFHRPHAPRPFLFSAFEIWTLILLAFVPLVICISTVASLFQSKRSIKLVLTPYGIAWVYDSKTVEIRWPVFFGLMHWSGDVLLCAFATSAFIPREAFKSPEEAHEFVQIMRELHKSRGAAWREEWNGKTFGSNT